MRSINLKTDFISKGSVTFVSFVKYYERNMSGLLVFICPHCPLLAVSEADLVAKMFCTAQACCPSDSVNLEQLCI